MLDDDFRRFINELKTKSRADFLQRQISSSLPTTPEVDQHSIVGEQTGRRTISRRRAPSSTY